LTYLDTSQLMPLLQSAYRPLHSTETAVTKVLSDVLSAIDNGSVAALVLLDLSAAVDTVDHEILLRRLESFGIGGCNIRWFKSYLVRDDSSSALLLRPHLQLSLNAVYLKGQSLKDGGTGQSHCLRSRYFLTFI